MSVTFVSRHAFEVAQIEVGEEVEAGHRFDVADGHEVLFDSAVVALVVGHEVGFDAGFRSRG